MRNILNNIPGHAIYFFVHLKLYDKYKITMSDEEKAKAAEERKNIKVTLQLANDIFQVMKDERMLEISADDRHKIVLQKYKNFADMYPVVLRFIARDVRYNQTAFRKMLEKMLRDQKTKSEADARAASTGSKKAKDPLDAMRSFITHQADYAKFLYMEESRRQGRHIDRRKANAIWNVEYTTMNKALKKIKKDEDSARNEFEDEKKKHLDERRQELLDFIMNEEMTESTISDDQPQSSEEPQRELTKEEKELDELTELEGYCKDLAEAYESFKKDENAEENDRIIPGIDSSDLEEYGYVLQYCKRIFDLAVKHDRMEAEQREIYEDQIDYCMSAIEHEYKRRADIVMQKKKELDAQWLEGLVPAPKKSKGPVKSKKSRKSAKAGTGKNRRH